MINLKRQKHENHSTTANFAITFAFATSNEKTICTNNDYCIAIAKVEHHKF